MRKIVLYIILLMLVLSACTADHEAMRQRLQYVSDCNRADTVFSEAWLPTVDSLVIYFDHHGSANDRMMAHYVQGRVYRDLGEAPQALECYQHAAEVADTTSNDCDLYTLYAVNGQMANLFHAQFLPGDEMQVLQMAEHIAWKINPTATAAKSTIANIHLMSSLLLFGFLFSSPLSSFTSLPLSPVLCPSSPDY